MLFTMTTPRAGVSPGRVGAGAGPGRGRAGSRRGGASRLCCGGGDVQQRLCLVSTGTEVGFKTRALSAIHDLALTSFGLFKILSDFIAEISPSERVLGFENGAGDSSRELLMESVLVRLSTASDKSVTLARVVVVPARHDQVHSVGVVWRGGREQRS